MTTTIMAKFVDGRLLVQESKLATVNYTSGGLVFRIGGIKKVEQLLSITNDFQHKGLAIDQSEVLMSNDYLIVPMRRNDGYVASGEFIASGGTVPANMSGIFVSGNAWMGEILSGVISGRVTVTANVIAR